MPSFLFSKPSSSLWTDRNRCTAVHCCAMPTSLIPRLQQALAKTAVPQRMLVCTSQSDATCLRRRQIQLDASGVASLTRTIQRIHQRGGPGAFYAGFLPNALKNLPNKGAACSLVKASKGRQPRLSALSAIWAAAR